MGITIAELTAKVTADGANTATNQIKQVGKAGDEASKKIKKGNESTNTSFKNMVRNAALVSAGLYAMKKAADVLIGAIATHRDFEAAISDLSAITGATGKDLEFLSQRSREFGESTTLSATQAAEAFKLIASAKPDLLESGEALAKVTQEAITLAEASGSTLPEAASTLGSALNQFGADADEAGRFINVLAAGAKFGASEIADTANALRDSGTVAASAGISFEELNAAIQSLSTVSIKGSRAGVGLRNIILKLQKDGKDLSAEMGGLTGALTRLLKSGIETTEVMELFGLENTTAAKALIENADSLENLTEKLTGTNTAYEQATVKVNNLEGDTKKLDSAWEELQLTVVGSGDPLRIAVQGTTNVVKVLTGSIDNLVIAGKVIASLMAGQLARNTVAYSISLAGTIRSQIQATTTADLYTGALTRVTTASRIATIASGGLRGVLGLLGGPVGIITTAAIALSFWATSAKTASKETSDLSNNTKDLANSMSQYDIASEINKRRKELAKYTSDLENVKDTKYATPSVLRNAELLIKHTNDKINTLEQQLLKLKEKGKEISDIISGGNGGTPKEVDIDFDKGTEGKINALKKSFMGERDLLAASLAEKRTLIESAYTDEIGKADEKYDLLFAIENEYEEKSAAIDEKIAERKDAIEMREAAKIAAKEAREAEALSYKIDYVDEILLTEEQRLEESYERRMFMVEEAFQSQIIGEDHKNKLLLGLEEKHGRSVLSLQAQTQQARLSLASNFFGGFAALAQAGGKKTFDLYKAFAVAETLISTYAAAQQAYHSQFLPIPDVTSPTRGAIAASAAIAGGLARLIAIKNATPGAGGAAAAGGGGGAGGGGAGTSGVGVNQNYIPTAEQRTPEEERDRPTLTVIFQGDMIGWDAHIRERVIGDIRNLVDNHDVIIMSSTSRNASELARTGT